MGTNRRYPHLSGMRAQERELLAAARHGSLQTLSEEQLALHRHPVTMAEGVVWGRAWLRFGDVDIRATVRVGAWTELAVGVEVEVGETVRRCWVWRGAVQALACREDAWE